MNEIKKNFSISLKISLKQDFYLNFFSTIMYNNYEVGITFQLFVEFIYNKPD
jgi:hypothetical protein